MSVVATGAGHFLIPTAPAAGTSVTSGTAPGFTSTAVVLSASTSAIYITGIYVESAAASAATYVIVRLMQGGAGAETAICDCPVALSTGSTVALGFFEIWPPLKVANATRLSVKTADSVGAKATLITVQCILQSNVVDDGIAVGTVTTVTNELTAAQIATGVWQDATAGDFTIASSIGKALFINNIAPGAAGGYPILGANTGPMSVSGGVTFSNSGGDAFTCTASGGNGRGLVVNGNGTGEGFRAVGGLTGTGMGLVGGGTSGTAMNLTTTAGDALTIAPTAGHGVTVTANGTTKHGFNITGGTAGISDGIRATAGSGGTDIRAANITGTLATVTTLTNLPAITANWLTATGINASALNGKGDWLLAANYTAPTNLTAAQIATGIFQDTTAGDFTAANSIGKSIMNGVALGTGLTVVAVSGAVGSVTGLTASNLDATVSSRLASASYAAPDNTSIAAIKVQSDKLTFTVANKLDCNIRMVNSITVNGAGTSGSPWGP